MFRAREGESLSLALTLRFSEIRRDCLLESCQADSIDLVDACPRPPALPAGPGVGYGPPPHRFCAFFVSRTEY